MGWPGPRPPHTPHPQQTAGGQETNTPDQGRPAPASTSPDRCETCKRRSYTEGYRAEDKCTRACPPTKAGTPRPHIMGRETANAPSGARATVTDTLRDMQNMLQPRGWTPWHQQEHTIPIPPPRRKTHDPGPSPRNPRASGPRSRTARQSTTTGRFLSSVDLPRGNTRGDGKVRRLPDLLGVPTGYISLYFRRHSRRARFGAVPRTAAFRS